MVTTHVVTAVVHMCTCAYTYVIILFHTHTGALEILAPNLCDLYIRTRFASKQHIWPPDQPRLFKNLTFLCHDSWFKQKKLSHVAARYRHTSKIGESDFDVKNNVPLFRELEQVHLKFCKSNATKCIADLFSNEDDCTLKNILVEGAPGIGKTELVKEIAYLWAKSEIICYIKVVFVLYLRDPCIHKLKSIEMFIHDYVNSKERYLDKEQAKSVIHELRNTQGSNIAFLMDGFDEFPSKVYEDSFIADLINGEVLPNALLLITSRPNVSLILHNKVSKVFDIVGFAKVEREQYILDSLKDLPEQQNNLHQYLKNYPIISSYCYIPLHLAIVIFLLKHNILPATLTRINELFILHTIYRSLQQHSKKYKTVGFDKLTDLPPQIFSVVHQLSKLAYNGVQNSKLVFSLEEIKQLCPKINSTEGTLNGFGLLQAVEHYNPLSALGKTASFNFLHYSMQEYLAAFYISTLSNEKQYSIMISFKPMNYVLGPGKFQTVEVNSFWHSQFVFMWLMYVGITGQSLAFISFLHNLGFFVNYPESALPYRRCSLNLIQILHLFQCFVEANNDRVCSILFEHILFKDGKISIKGFGMPLFSHHMLSLVNFLTKSPKQYKSLEFVNCVMLDGTMDILEDYFLTYSEKVRSLKHVRFENVFFVSTSVIPSTVIETVSEITIINIDNYDIKSMVKSLANNQNLSVLEIQEMKKNDMINPLMQNLLNSTTLVSLNIAHNLFTCSDARSIADFMSVNSTLRFLDISSNIIGLSKEVFQFPVGLCIPANKLVEYQDNCGVIAIAFALKENTSLLSLNLSYNCIAFILQLAFGLYHNTVLISLDLSKNLLYQDECQNFYVLGKALRYNKALRSFNISKNNICDAKMYKIITALYYNKTLQSLDISENGLTSSLVEDLAYALKYNSCLSLLALGSNSIGDEGAIHLSSVLSVNKTLTALYVRDNMITNVGAKAIAAALKKNTVLKKLDLSMNDISDEGALALCDTFYIKNTLKVLFILFNPIIFAKVEEIFAKLASEDTICYRRYDVFMSMTNKSVTKVAINRSNKQAEVIVTYTGDITTWYVLTSNKRIVAFTHEKICYDWKKSVFHDICLQYMYAHACTHHANNILQEECLKCYKMTTFNQLYTFN